MASDNGPAGVASVGNGELTLTNSTIYGNSALSTTVDGEVLHSSHAFGSGGGIVDSCTNLTLYDCTIADNTADG